MTKMKMGQFSTQNKLKVDGNAISDVWTSKPLYSKEIFTIFLIWKDTEEMFVDWSDLTHLSSPILSNIKKIFSIFHFTKRQKQTAHEPADHPIVLQRQPVCSNPEQIYLQNVPKTDFTDQLFFQENKK